MIILFCEMKNFNLTDEDKFKLFTNTPICHDIGPQKKKFKLIVLKSHFQSFSLSVNLILVNQLY